jgi:type VI secretion system secreted protein Hcp
MSMIMKIEDSTKIQGESLVDGFKNAIDLLSINHNIVKPMLADKSSNARGTDRSYHSDFVVRMRLNKAYPLLLKACNHAQHLGDVTVHLTKVSDGKTVEVLVYTLKKSFVSRVELVPESEENKVNMSNPDSTTPIVEYAINYQSIDAVFKPNSLSDDISGNVTSGSLTGLGGGE